MTTAAEEVFAPIAGSPGYYVGDRGTVLSAKRGRFIELRGMVKSNRYVSVNLWNAGVSKTCTVHSLVAEAFLGPRPAGHQVLHYDGSRDNNDICNLSWGTPRQNVEDAWRHGTRPPPRPQQAAIRLPATACRNGHEFNSRNTYRRPDGSRRCRTCLLAYLRERRQVRRAA